MKNIFETSYIFLIKNKKKLIIYFFFLLYIADYFFLRIYIHKNQISNDYLISTYIVTLRYLFKV